MKRLRDFCCLMVFFTAFLHGSWGQSYRVIDLGQLGRPEMGLNNFGQVVGTTSDNLAFLWQQGIATNIGTLGTTSFGRGINDSGEVVGYSYNGSSMRAYMFTSGQMNDLGALSGAVASFPQAVNNSGQATGYTNTGPGGNPEYATLWENGTVTTIGLGSPSWGNAINASGTIVGGAPGSHAFVYTTTSGVQLLPNLPGGNSSQALALNDAGLIAGCSSPTNFNCATRAVLWNNGSITDLGLLTTPANFLASQALGINSSTQVVGFSSISLTTTHGFLYDTAHGMRDLNAFVRPSSGWSLTIAVAINDAGIIIGSGVFNGQDSHGFVMIPIPSVAISMDDSNVCLSAGSVASGWSYTLQSSTNLMTWDDVSSTTATNGFLNWLDTISSDNQSKFYRLKW